jgi:hypothetical protein
MAETKKKTHADLQPRGMCPALLMKQMLTHSMDDEVHDQRRSPGDGYYWCAKTCTPVGPDDELVHPSRCLPQRRCWDGPQA